MHRLVYDKNIHQHNSILLFCFVLFCFVLFSEIYYRCLYYMSLSSVITDDIKSYTAGFFAATLLVVYVFKIPERITGASKLVNEYYYDNAAQSFLLDFFLIFAYLRIAGYGARALGAKTQIQKAIVVVATTMLLSSGFMALFLRQPPNSSFFARWFGKAGFNAVYYDMVIVTSVFLLSNGASTFLCK